MQTATHYATIFPARKACHALALSLATYHRLRKNPLAFYPPKSSPKAQKTSANSRSLSLEERAEVLAVLHEERFMDESPATVYATLLDEERRLCSVRTMYRILRSQNENARRGNFASHPKREAPELLATAPRQVWTWDITHLRTAQKGATLKLYVCLDLFSRYVVGWYLSPTESCEEARHFFEKLAKKLTEEERKNLVVHADNGGPMRGQLLADFLRSSGITKSHSRPHTSNDNPFSEAQFKTLKYRPDYPRFFENEGAARTWCTEFFAWYNSKHRHSGVAYFTPADVHFGLAESKQTSRQQTLNKAYQQTKNRFVNGAPKATKLATEVSINPKNHPKSAPVMSTSN